MPRKGKPSPPATTDLPTGLAYGVRKELETTQGVTNDVAAMQAARRPRPEDTLSAANGFTMPTLTPLGAPSERPGEPVTTGLGIGAGAGPEALGQFAPGGPDPDLIMLLRHLPVLELVSSGASVASRNLIRRLRGSVPMPGSPQAQALGGGGGASGRGGPQAPPAPVPSPAPTAARTGPPPGAV